MSSGEEGGGKEQYERGERRRWSSFERLLVCDYFIGIPDISPLKAEDGVMKLFTKSIKCQYIYKKKSTKIT